MQHIRQRKGSNDCGHCCVAMLVGTDLETARQTFSEHRQHTRTKLTDIRLALEKHGATVPLRKLKFADQSVCDRNKLKGIGSNVLLKVPNGTRSSYHWVVWNAEARRFFDPLAKKPQKKLPVKVIGYYPVIPI